MLKTASAAAAGETNARRRAGRGPLWVRMFKPGRVGRTYSRDSAVLELQQAEAREPAREPQAQAPPRAQVGPQAVARAWAEAHALTPARAPAPPHASVHPG